jgi:gliding motility-associated-like protein
MMKNFIFQKPVQLFTFFYLVCQTLNAQSTCHTFQYKGSGVITTSSCSAALNAIPIADISLSVTPPCTIVTTPSFSVATDVSTNISYNSLNTAIPAGSTLNVRYVAKINDGTTDKTINLDFSVVIRETVSPTFATPLPTKDITINCNLLPPPTVNATDNCSSNVTVTLSQTGNANACGNSGIVTRTWTARDRSGNTATYVQTITIQQDNSRPSIGVTADNNIVACAAWQPELDQWLNDRGGSAASDNCGVVTDVRYIVKNQEKTKAELISIFADSLALNKCVNNVIIGGGNTNQVRAMMNVGFYYRDACGNPSDTTYAIFAAFNNDVPSLIAAANDISIECDTANIDKNLTTWITNGAGAQFSDGCSKISLRTIPSLNHAKDSLAVSQGKSCGNTGKIKVKFYGVDICGNISDTTEATFTVIDKRKPRFTKQAVSRTFECGANLGDSLNHFIATRGGATATDGCGGVAWTYTWREKNGTAGQASAIPSIKAGCSWYVDFNFIALDECNNRDTTKARFTIQDTKAPNFTTMPSNITLNCGAPLPPVPTPTATDACGNTATVTYRGQSASTWANCAAGFSITRTWEASDSCGNKSQITQIIYIKDEERPTIDNIPNNITVNDCDSIPAIPANIKPKDNCDSMPKLTFREISTKGTDPNACSFYAYTITRTWTATDQCGNVGTQTQIITVRDRKAPVFTLPSDTSIECYLVDNITLTGTVEEIRDCDANPDITFNDVYKGGNNTCQAKAVIERTWRVTDACGNFKEATQKITSQDNEPPLFKNVPADLTLTCKDPVLIPNSAITAKDTCDITFDPSSIWSNYYEDFNIECGRILSVTRFWEATDACGNTSSASQTIYYRDTEAPEIVNCQSDLTVNVNTNNCSASYTIAKPIVDEDCGTFVTPVIKAASSAISSTMPGSLTTPVRDITLNFPFNETTVLSNIRLSISLKNADAEDAQEFFNIVGEDGTILGKTNPTASQCGSGNTVITSISANQLYSWGADNSVRLFLRPNKPVNSAFAINDICANATADVTLSYTIQSQPQLSYAIKINNGAIRNLALKDTSLTLSAGTHQIVQYIKDCEGNGDSCSYKVTVKDMQPPQMTTPVDGTLSISSNCEISNLLRAPSPMSDNCSFGTMFSQKQLASGSDSLLNFSYDPNYLTNLADDVVFTFTGVTQSGLNTPASLKIDLKAKANNATNAYFDIYGENNVFLGRTAVTSCANASTTTLSISPLQINQWSLDGKIVINAVRFKGIDIALAGSNPGVSACDVVANNKDGVSWMTASLSYNTANPTYYVTGATRVSPRPFYQSGVPPMVTFKRGNSIVWYVLADAEGNKDTVSYKVFVTDGLNPIARCKNAIVDVNPFTAVNTTIDPLLIDAGSSDNCGIFSYSVSPAALNCNDAGQTKTLTLTVTDSVGRASSCTSTVFVEKAEAKPSYKLGLCGSDTLALFANPPVPASNTVVYTYKWEGPNGFVSTEANPKIPSVSQVYAGTYRVTVTNPFAANCDVVGTVVIPINPIPNTPILNASATRPCTNAELTLSTQPYSGANIRYKWYRGVPSSAVLVDSTIVPTWTIKNPTDTARYYVAVTISGCTSNPSAPILITPVKPIVATTTNPSIVEICEGENIALGTTIAGLNYTYQWSGPNGFTAATQYPPVITNAKPINNGVYALIISANGCASNPVTTQVNVKAKPIKPQIAVTGRDCEGATVNLITNIVGVTSYRWIKPDFSEEPTQANLLVLSGLNVTRRGNWRVYAIKDGCRSEESDPVSIAVNPRPAVVASFQAPVCEGGQLTLNGSAPMGSSYVWSSAIGTLGNTQNITVFAQAGNYTLSSIAPNGCDNTSTISVTPTPAPQVTVVSSNAAGACVNGSTNATLVPTIVPFSNDLGYSYQWTGTNVSSTERILTIPNVTAAANGNYILVVTNPAGCKSKPFTYNLGVKNIPSTPSIKGNVTQSVCEGTELLLELENTYSGTNIKYIWKTPAGDSTVTNPTFRLTNLKSFNAGDYAVKVSIDGCESSYSGTKKIIVNPIPQKPTVTTNSPICEGGSIRLATPQITGATYEWTGPGFSSGIAEPIIPNANKDKEGVYRVRVIINGCASELSDNSIVTVNATPTQIPSIKNPDAVCMDSPNPSAALSIDPNAAIAGAIYTWYNTNNTVVSAASAQLNVNLSLATYPKKDTTYEFYVIATVNGCPTKSSIPVALMTNKIPNQQAFAGADVLVCDANSVILNAAKPIVGTGVWIQTEGSSITIANPTSANSAINGLVANQNYTLQWKLSNGACKDYAFDEVKIRVNDTSIKAEAGDSINVCAKNTIQLNAKSLPAGITGRWSQFVSQEQLGIKITEPNNPITTVTGLTPGNKYTFKWTISNPACPDYSSDEVIVTVASPQGVAQVEADKKICGNSATITAVPVAGVNGLWKPVDANSAIQIVSPTSTTTSAKNLQAGINRIYWALNNAVCGTYSTDTLTLTTEVAATAKDDNLSVAYAGSAEIAVAANDLIPTNGFILSLSTLPKFGAAKVSADGKKIEYRANNGYAGADELEYEICNAACPDACTNGKVFITVLGGNDCTIPTIITPNEDSTNDRWEIPCLANPQYANNNVVVFNQWGDEVFRAFGYKNDWEGTYNGRNLPEGTYFFVVDFGNGEKKNGFLIIER